MEQGNTSPDKLTTEPPNITVDYFEDYLLTDNLLVDYFNVFLSLLNFPMPILFNKETETFEIVDNAKKNLLRKLKSLVRAYTPVDPIYNVTIKSKEKHPLFEPKITALDLTFENNFIVKYLDHVQGIAWIKNERLPAFLMSDCYFEYRLAKLLSQLECSTGPGIPQIDPAYRPWDIEKEEEPMSKIVDEVEATTEEVYIDHEEGNDLVSVHSEASLPMTSVLLSHRTASVPQTEAMLIEAGEEIPIINIPSEGDTRSGIEAATNPSVTSMVSVESNKIGISVMEEIMFSVEAQKLPVGSHNSRQQSHRANLNTAQDNCVPGLSKPMVVDDNLFEFIPEYPLQGSEIVFLEVKSEGETERNQEERKKEKEEVSTNDKAGTHKQQVSTDGKAATHEEKVSIDDQTQIHEEKVSIDDQTQIHEEKVSIDDQTQIHEEKVSIDDQTQIHEEKVSIDDQTQIHEEKVSIDDQTQIHEEKVSIDDQTQIHEEDKAATQRTETNLPSKPDETKTHLDNNAKIDTHTASTSNMTQATQLNEQQSSAVNDNIKTQGFSENMGEESTESDSSNKEDDIRDICYVTPRHSYNFKSRKGIEKFKKFLQGTAGEKYWWLWMDLERLKTIKDGKKKQSYMNKIRNRYLFNSGEYCLNAETRAKLGLSFVYQWTVENLCQLQSDIVAPLLLYWGPRYCINQGFSIRQAGIVLKDWEDRQLRPKSDVGPFAMILPNPVKRECIPKEKKTKQNHKLHQRQRKVPQKRQSPNKCCTRTMIDIPVSNQEIKEQLLPSIDSICSQVSNFLQDLEDPELRKAKDHRNLETLMQVKKYHEALCDSKTDDLLQALHNESRTGYIFTRFCEQTGNVLWNNALNLWFDLKEYQRLFYAEIFQPFKLKRQAQASYEIHIVLIVISIWRPRLFLCKPKITKSDKEGLTGPSQKQSRPKPQCCSFIFATYTVEGAPADVQIDTENKKKIYSKLEPPFEELFDQLEEHTLILLLVPWIQMIEMDLLTYRKVKLVTKTRHLDSIYYKKLLELQRKILPNEEFPLPVRSDSMEEIPDDYKSSWQMVPEEFHNYTFNALLRNRLELDHFQAFLRENLADMDLNCWLDIEHYRNIPNNQKENKDSKSKEVIGKYLNRKYFFGPSSPATKAQRNKVMALAGGRDKLLHNLLSSEVATEVQKYAKARIERQWLPMFLSTPEFAERHHIRVKLQDVVEDQMLQKSRKKRDVMKNIDNKWTASSKEIIAFRKALLNPVTALQFRKYVSTKGELMENNVLFWLEVQKYKDLCHSHASDETIQNKITVIINCFINSSIPPPLQIDIPPEYASTIIDQREELGPYIFREAQMAVFDILFKLWPEFSDFRHRVAVESIQLSLERKSIDEQEMIPSKKTDKHLPESMERAHSVKTKGIIQPSSLDTGSKSSGSQLSLKGGSDKRTQDQRETKSGNSGTTQQQGSRQSSQKLSWSFSKYIEALNREEALILIAREANRKEVSRMEASRMEASRMEAAPVSVALPESSNSQDASGNLN
ncbi:regulator of G-protein signaling 22-like [Heterodontus francisci]|uniref:regulator of G-protein signaling 22-like n=1 Tax=Heterodontus francisci TaxID=7792 RepID=UPI00355B1BA6